MTVYVDQLFRTSPGPRWPYRQACHLLADSVEELHVFARRIGLKREWFQERNHLAHYDLTAGMRRKAIAAGAVQVTETRLRKLVRQLDRRRPQQ